MRYYFEALIPFRPAASHSFCRGKVLYSLIRSVSAAFLTLVLVFLVGCQESVSETELAVEQYNNVLQRSNLLDADSTAVLVRELQFPAGWTAPKHYHSGELFINVIKGEFEVTIEGSDPVVYSTGDALEMRAGTNMHARNPSPTNSLKLVAFQVGNPDAPFVVPVPE